MIPEDLGSVAGVYDVTGLSDCPRSFANLEQIMGALGDEDVPTRTVFQSLRVAHHRLPRKFPTSCVLRPVSEDADMVARLGPLIRHGDPVFQLARGRHS